jgi:hypothetical protein
MNRTYAKKSLSSTIAHMQRRILLRALRNHSAQTLSTIVKQTNENYPNMGNKITLARSIGATLGGL